MANLRNNTLAVLVCMSAFATPALAQNYDYLSRSDGISLSGGDANRANIAIQTPTPWPYYLNRTNIRANGQRAADLMEMYSQKYKAAAPSSSGATVNVTAPGQ